jgi:4-hydroxyphenylpyruvate dioxygenase
MGTTRLKLDRTGREPLGLKGVAALHRYCHSLDSNRRFLCGRLDFEEIGVSSPELEERTKQRSAIFRAGECVVVCSEPLGEGPAGRYLNKHPEGIGAIAFDVEDIERALRVLDRRGGTPISNVQRFSSDEGLGIFSIATPLDDVRFHFVERQERSAPLPGFIMHDTPQGGANKYGFKHYDHITSNFQTMGPAVLWMEHVLGLTHHWDIEFHTEDMAGDGQGSGLRSIVMVDEGSGIKFANNEPVRPNFEDSQVSIFCDDQRGNGVQHAAMVIEDIVQAVPQLKDAGVRFVRTPSAYYDNLDEHLARQGVKAIEEDQALLRELEILVDGEGDGRYLLQIFMEDAARFEGDPKRSPFFFEVIQRKGDEGFGAGNFRALFEGVERTQQKRLGR